MPPVRFDAKTVLAMFNQSRLASDEAAQKDRIAAINQSLEETKMADERKYRQDTVEELKRQHDQAAAWHADEVGRQAAADMLTAQWHAEETERAKTRDAALDRYNQGMLGYYNRMASIAENKQLDANGKPMTDSQYKAFIRARDLTLKQGLAADLNAAMKGFNFDTSPSSAFSKGAEATKNEMQQSMNVYNNVLSTLQKYDEQGYPATALNRNLLQKIRTRLGQSNDWLKTIHEIKEDPNVSASDQTGIYPGATAIGISPRIPVIPNDQKSALYNQWMDINARLSQFDESGMSQAGYIQDPATGKLYQYKP